MKANHTTPKNATRRSFLKKGALLAVPLAAAAAPAALVADDSLKSRLARLEDEAAIRNLHETWLRRLNAADASAATPLVATRSAGNAEGRGFNPAVAGEPASAVLTPEAAAAGRRAAADSDMLAENLCGSWLQPRHTDRKIETALAAEAPVAPAVSGAAAFGVAEKKVRVEAPGLTLAKSRISASGASGPGPASGETIRRIAPDHAAAPGAIEFASDGTSASGRFHCLVEIETPIARDSTLAQMAHAQGSGWVRRTERRLLRVEYAKSSGTWRIASAALAPA